MSLPKREAEASESDRHQIGNLDLPEWLVELKPIEDADRPAAAPTAKKGNQQMPSEPRHAPHDEPWQPAGASLVSEEDLPEWLRALSDEPAEPAPAPPVPGAPSSGALPTWAEAAPPPAAAAAAAEPPEAPPVWVARRAKARSDEREPVAAPPAAPEIAAAAMPVAEAATARPTGQTRGSSRGISKGTLVLLLLVLVIAVAAAVYFI